MSSKEPEDSGRQRNAAAKITGRFVGARRDGPVLLEPGKEIFDPMEVVSAHFRYCEREGRCPCRCRGEKTRPRDSSPRVLSAKLGAFQKHAGQQKAAQGRPRNLSLLSISLLAFLRCWDRRNSCLRRLQAGLRYRHGTAQPCHPRHRGKSKNSVPDFCKTHSDSEH